MAPLKSPLAGLLGLALVVLARPAPACINDNELPTHEREFRSQYGVVAERPPTRIPEPRGLRVLTASGAALLAAAAILSVTPGRRGTKPCDRSDAWS